MYSLDLGTLKGKSCNRSAFRMINCFLLWLICSVVAWYSCCNILEPKTEILTMRVHEYHSVYRFCLALRFRAVADYGLFCSLKCPQIPHLFSQIMNL